MQASTQAFFGNGEMWGLVFDNAYGFAKLSKTPSVSPVLSMPTSWANNLKVTQPYTVQAGAVGLKGLRIAVDRNWDNMYKTIYDDEFQVQRILDDT